ncbi:hypothetical protein F4809DRAFT_641077 [Biscogniauxia mediterranea]|nr:hypothetical protein F4809DRAFT_641077 [Biscogniauxia mediterranea]
MFKTPQLGAQHIAPVLLGAAACLLAVTLTPPTPLVYSLKAEYGTSSLVDTPATVWFGTFGYCVESAKAVSDSSLWRAQCSQSQMGYDTTDLLNREGDALTSPAAQSGPTSLSLFMTLPIGILRPVSLALCVLTLLAYPIIYFRPKASSYLLVLIMSLVTLLVSTVPFIMEFNFASRIRRGGDIGSVPDSASFGPGAYASIWAFIWQLSACGLLFYSSIGGEERYESEHQSPEAQSLIEKFDSAALEDERILREKLSPPACEKRPLADV